MAALRSFDDEPKLRRERDAWATMLDAALWRGIRSGTALWDREEIRVAEDRLRNAEHRLALLKDEAEAHTEEAAA